MQNPQPPDKSLCSIQSLLAFYDKEFVLKAYETILGRSPDSGGLENYLAQVRRGVDRAAILAELIRSPEGKLRSTVVPELQEFLEEYPGSASLFFSRLYRRFVGLQSRQAEQDRRAFENRLYLIEQRIANQAQLIEDLQLILCRGLSTAHGIDSINQAHVDNESELSDSYKGQQTLDIARTVIELKSAIALKRRR